MKLFLKIFLPVILLSIFSGSLKAQSDEEDFIKFWDEFKTAAIKDDTAKLIQLSDFPMIYFINEFVKWNEEDFLVNFERMFGYKDIFTKAEFGKEILFSEDEDGRYLLSLIEDRSKPEAYYLAYEFISKEDEYSFEITYNFDKVNGIYKFTKYIEAD